ncbi:DUF2516 family protein [Nesterenkonia sp. Act20]|uniref:DUF2516 family protein n=1 Tax=Nesterenkonia sp. Act20 TaxID=1483432 RepID=UPI001C479ADF|nr:DUF2516 family protein [Nesterenkonia sp. Act20]
MDTFSSIWLFVLRAEFWIQFAFAFACLIVAVVAFIKCVPKNAQRFDIAFKRTKGFWLGMTGGAVVLALLGALGSTPFGLIFPVAAACMAMVYLTDVNPAVSE